MSSSIPKIVPTIIFIILPIIYILFVSMMYIFFQLNFSTITISNIFLGFILIINTIYIIYSLFIPFGKYLNKIRYDYAVIGFEYLKKIVKLTFIFLIIMLVIFNFVYLSTISSYEKQLQNSLSGMGIKIGELQSNYYLLEYYNFGALFRQEYSPIWDITLILLISVFTGIIKLTLQFRKGNFRVNYAEGCIRLSLSSIDDTQKMQYIFKGLNSYNHYLQKKLKITIEKLKEFYFYLSVKDSHQRTEVIELLLKSFQNNNSLLPLYTLISIKNINPEELLTPFSQLRYWQTLFEQWKTAIVGIISFLIAVVPPIIATLKFFFPNFFLGI